MSAVSAVVAQPIVGPRRAAVRRRGARVAAVPASRTGSIVRAAAGNGEPIVKVCGVTTPEDARYAAEAGATFIGMILWPKSKRSISLEVGKEIADAAKEAGATPVGVFVDESADEIVAAMEATGCTIAQLHGDNARQALEDLPMRIPAIYAVSATPEGQIVTKFPGDDEKLAAQRREAMKGETGWRAAVDWVNGPRRTIDWILVDGVTAGSGETYDWTQLSVPRGMSRKGWILAGGLTPENVSEAIMTACPDCVDVASGVTADGVVKDPVKVDAFMSNVKAAAAKLE